MPTSLPPPPTRRRRGLAEHTVQHLAGAMNRALLAERLARTDGLLQRLDPRVKVVGLLAFAVAAAAVGSTLVLLGLLGLAVTFALLSRVPLLALWRMWTGVLVFTGLIALPAVFLTPGDVLYRVPLLDWPVTAQGVRAAGRLLLRAETTATFPLLLILCTPWVHVLKALRVCGMPAVLVVILGMTHRYLFVLLQVARDMHEAKRSRTVGALGPADHRRLAVASIGVLLERTHQLTEEVHLSMLARGFRGEVHTLDDFRARWWDGIALVAFLGTAGAALWLGT
jgi:cobalt ECF transporter T component CbiQ